MILQETGGAARPAKRSLGLQSPEMAFAGPLRRHFHGQLEAFHFLGIWGPRNLTYCISVPFECFCVCNQAPGYLVAWHISEHICEKSVWWPWKSVRSKQLSEYGSAGQTTMLDGIVSKFCVGTRSQCPEWLHQEPIPSSKTLGIVFWAQCQPEKVPWCP